MNFKSLLIILCFIPFSAISQESKQNISSEIEEFSAKAGTLKEKLFIKIGTVKGVQIDVYKVTDLIDDRSVSGLRIQYETGGTYSATKVAVLDSDELDGLIKSIKTLQNKVFPTTREAYTEVTYRSRSGFEAGAYFDVKKSKWACYLQIDKYDRKSLVLLSAEDFGEFLGYVEAAKQKI